SAKSRDQRVLEQASRRAGQRPEQLHRRRGEVAHREEWLLECESDSSEEDAHIYAEGVRRGGTLVTARVPESEAARYEAILDRSAVSIRERARIWERNGL